MLVYLTDGWPTQCELLGGNAPFQHDIDDFRDAIPARPGYLPATTAQVQDLGAFGQPYINLQSNGQQRIWNGMGWDGIPCLVHWDSSSQFMTPGRAWSWSSDASPNGHESWSVCSSTPTSNGMPNLALGTAECQISGRARRRATGVPPQFGRAGPLNAQPSTWIHWPKLRPSDFEFQHTHVGGAV
jgi:hypothetical protein